MHVPLEPTTRHMMSDAQFAKMKRTALYISTCRGPVTDEAALIRALKARTIFGAAIDVVENELWLTTNDEWEAFKAGRKELRMEFWYRRVRGARGWLMEERDGRAEPVGGTWNLDKENRKRLVPGTTVPAPPVPERSWRWAV